MEYMFIRAAELGHFLATDLELFHANRAAVTLLRVIFSLSARLIIDIRLHAGNVVRPIAYLPQCIHHRVPISTNAQTLSLIFLHLCPEAVLIKAIEANQDK
jgi:hypothetical protein